MATRFYLNNSGPAEVNPPFNAGWETTGSADRIKLVPKKAVTILTALGNKNITVSDGVVADYLNRQFVSKPIPSQYFTGTVSLVIRCIEGSSLADSTLAVVISVVSQDASINRGILFSVFGTGTEFPNISAETRIVNNQTTTPLITQPGDRVCVEIGLHTSGPVGNQSTTERFGTNAASDFALT